MKTLLNHCGRWSGKICTRMLFSLFMLCALVVVYLSNQSGQYHTAFHADEKDELPGEAKRPKIVYWAKPPHNIVWTFIDLPNGDGGCDLSFDRDDAPTADALVFVMKTCKPDDLPPFKLRRANQVYIWYSHESAWTSKHFYKHSLTQYDGYFNWTMTHRADSDVVAPMWPIPALDYFLYTIGRTADMIDENLAKNAKLAVEDHRSQVTLLVKMKTNLAAWIVSDCTLTQGARSRTRLVRKLEAAGLKLSKYGKCVHNPLSFNLSVLFETLSAFKFYLAFENSFHCTDYLTEKTVYNGFMSGAVPVIHGPSKQDVAKLLPKGSYIHVGDFKKLKDLVNFLLYLDHNDTAYQEYFNWWMDPGAQTFPRYGFNFGATYRPRIAYLPQYSHGYVQDDWLENQRFGLYHLCRRLKRGDHINQRHTLPSLADWWYGSEPPECKQ